MKKAFLLLLFVVTTVVALRAQDEPSEQTAAPEIIVVEYETYYQVTIVNSEDEPYAEIYYSVIINGDYCGDGVYNDYEPLAFQGAGSYIIAAYAISPGKFPSETVNLYFDIPQIVIYVPAYDFIVDGIYYKIESDSTVWVSTRAIGKCINDFGYVPHAEGPSYSGDVMIPGSVEYDGQAYTVTGLADCAFEGCDLNSVYLPNTIELIRDDAFHDCTGLKTIIIPESVTEICQNAFWWCVDLKRVICKAVTPPDAFWTAFWYNYERATLFVPAEVLEVYRTHQVWGRFTHIVPFVGAGPGDINGNGEINIADVTGLIDQLLSGDELPDYFDVNGDGDVTIGDVTALIDMLLGTD